MWHALSHFFGLDNLSGPYYGFWSGAGSDISELTLVGAAVVHFKHLNCHKKGCWRLGHPHEGKVACRRHFDEVHGA